jgi:hypothetical protein
VAVAAVVTGAAPALTYWLSTPHATAKRRLTLSVGTAAIVAGVCDDGRGSRGPEPKRAPRVTVDGVRGLRTHET